MVALILVISVVSLIITWVNDKLEDSAKDLAVSAGAELLPEDQQVTLTQAELDDMLTKAAEDAAAESDARVAEVIAQTELEKEQAAQEARKAVLDGIKTGLETGDDTMVEVLRPFYPDDIVVVSSGKFNFVPINKELQMNGYDSYKDYMNAVERDFTGEMEREMVNLLSTNHTFFMREADHFDFLRKEVFFNAS